jgi:sec-independent protein translocase protein TatB
VFNVGGGELIVIALIALIVLGPQRLPEAARQVGKVMGDLRKLSNGFQNEMKSAFTEADDPTRVAARRNVLAKEAPTDPPVEATGDAELVADEDPEQDDDGPVAEPVVEESSEPAEVDPAVSAAVAAVAAPRDPPANAKVTPPAGAKTTSATAKAAPAAAADDPTVPEDPSPRSTP